MLRVGEKISGVEGVLFDFDGTLVGSRESLLQSFARFASSHGVIATEDVIRQFDGLTTFEIVEKAKAEWKLEGLLAELTRQYFCSLTEAYSCVAECKNATSTLAVMKSRGFEMGLVTSAARELVEPVLRRFRWTDLFDSQTCGERNIAGKPDPALYLLAIDSLQCSSDAVVVVEDSLAGVKSATAALLTVVAVSDSESGETFRNAGASLVVRDLQELGVVLS